MKINLSLSFCTYASLWLEVFLFKVVMNYEEQELKGIELEWFSSFIFSYVMVFIQIIVFLVVMEADFKKFLRVVGKVGY